jgi:hypothetical protein
MTNGRSFGGDLSRNFLLNIARIPVATRAHRAEFLAGIRSINPKSSRIAL